MKLYKTKKNCGKLLLGILAFCTGMILLTGCGSSSEQKQNKNEETAEENKEEDKVQIGLTVDSFVIERWIRDRDVFVATARELGAEVNVQDAGADVKEQISQIEYFINKQVDVIVVIARDCGALSDAIQKAQSAGIPVISYDRMVNNANTDLYISFDNRKVGEIMAQAGYQILLANTSNQVEKELEFLKIFRTNNVDGVIFMGTLMSKRHLTVMRSYQKPIVLLAQQEEIIPSVYFDDYQSAYLATEILLKRDCREIAYIGVTLKDRAVGRNRRIGFTDALAQYQIQPDERKMVETQFDMEDGYEAARILMERNVPFDGIFCATAELAFGAMSYLRQQNVHVPEQVKVSAVGNNRLATLYDPPLTTVSLSHRTGGSEAAAMLLDLIQEQEIPRRSEKMICCLHERKSTLG